VNGEYFRYSSCGDLYFEIDDGYWGFLLCDKGIMDYYAWLAKRKGMVLQKGSSRGCHITFIRGEEPVHKELWDKHQGSVDFFYANVIRCDNGRHAWLDVWCPRFHDIRSELGLPPKTKMSFHMTVGRLT
jgi:hypothetical protein